MTAAKKRRGPRPKHTGLRVTVRLTPDQTMRLLALGKQTGETVSDLVRRAVDGVCK